ncbi:MAG TPA: hypothetical protein PKN95_07025 [Verrucomicrobiota bacterium]|nr:hypothetical protein [Verrucomicrobiota bacterium]HNT13415.1 hypothetical protein [Verrucomicrobiota bacterium]
MNWLSHQGKRVLVPGAALALIAGYLFGLLPLKQQSENLKAPLRKEWTELARTLGDSNRLSIDFGAITSQLEHTRLALRTLEQAWTQAATRCELSPATEERMQAPFQLVDYENERGRQQDELRQVAAKLKATLSPAVFEGFPTHSTAVTQPALLWAELEMVTGLLHTALQCGIPVVESLTVAYTPSNAPVTSTNAWVRKIPIQIELTAPAPTINRLLQALPMRTNELAAAPLALTLPGPKPALYVDHILLRKQTPTHLEEVRATVQVAGFVFSPPR